MNVASRSVRNDLDVNKVGRDKWWRKQGEKKQKEEQVKKEQTKLGE